MGYKIKRFSYYRQKEYGMGDAAGAVVNGVRDVTGNVVEGAGKMVDSGVGKLAAGGAGAYYGASLGAGLLGSAVPILGHIAGGIGGALIGGSLGSTAAEATGKTLKSVGQDIHS